MAKLSTIKPRVGVMAGRLTAVPAAERGRSRWRDDHLPWRRWYKTARWQKLRWSILVRDQFICQMCKRLEPDTAQLVADHKEPHRGDEVLFWDDRNLWCLCKTCHDSEKQKQERRGW